MNPFTLDKTIPRAVKMLQNMINPKYVSVDKQIPLTLLRHCEGVAFIRIYKAGMFILGGNIGGGCVICKVEDPNEPLGYRWSAPVAVQCGGLGGGFVFGGERIDSVIILNTKSAIRAFTGRGQVTFGGNVSLAVGPVGKDIEAHVGVSDNKELVAAYSYSQAKGAYIGGTLEGAFLVIRNDENKRYYGSDNATGENLLAGTIAAPFVAQELGTELSLVVSRQGVYSSLASTKSMKDVGGDSADLAKSGRELVKKGLSSGNLNSSGSLLPDWEAATSPDGKTYYYNTKTNATTWEKPVAAAAPPPMPAAKPSSAQKQPSMRAPPKVPTRPVAAAPAQPAVPTKTAMYDYTASQPDELSFKEGDKVEILGQSDPNWLQGRIKGKTGLVPATYLQ